MVLVGMSREHRFRDAKIVTCITHFEENLLLHCILLVFLFFCEMKVPNLSHQSYHGTISDRCAWFNFVVYFFPSSKNVFIKKKRMWCFVKPTKHFPRQRVCFRTSGQVNLSEGNATVTSLKSTTQILTQSCFCCLLMFFVYDWNWGIL